MARIKIVTPTNMCMINDDTKVFVQLPLIYEKARLSPDFFEQSWEPSNIEASSA